MTSQHPDLACPNCGSTAAPIQDPGAGPHFARLSCSTCGRFLRWLPKPPHLKGIDLSAQGQEDLFDANDNR